MGLIGFLKNLGNNTLYYPGCMLKFGMEREMENYKQIFNLLKIDFILIPDEVCCGSPVYNAGYKKDARKLAEKSLEIFKSRRVTKIITPCPGCYNMFKNEFPKLIRNWDIEVEHASQTILKKLSTKKPKRALIRQVVTYHDPCHLGRFSNIYDEPRKIIKILDGELKEMTHNRENALCCGAGGGLRSNYPGISKDIAKKRVNEAPKDASNIITPCGLCTSNLKTADDRTIEFSEWMLERIKLKYF